MHVGTGGLGDQLNGFLMSATIALLTRRRLELAPSATGYVQAGFTLPFDARFTGSAELLAAASTRPPLDCESISRLAAAKNASGVRSDRLWALHRLPHPTRTSAAAAMFYCGGVCRCSATTSLMEALESSADGAGTRVLDREYEFVVGANAGMHAFGVLWRALVRRGFAGVTPRARCVFLHWLRPTAEVVAAVDRLQPWKTLPGETTLAIHIRAEVKRKDEGPHANTRQEPPLGSTIAPPRTPPRARLQILSYTVYMRRPAIS